MTWGLIYMRGILFLAAICCAALSLCVPVSADPNYIYAMHDPGGAYWAECACKLGSQTAQDFDSNPGTWTMIKKFSDSGTNGNGNTWTQYTTTLNTGSYTQLTIGFKHGASSCTGPTVCWDTMVIQ